MRSHPEKNEDAVPRDRMTLHEERDPAPDARALAHRMELQRRAGLDQPDPDPGWDRLTRLACRATGAPVAVLSAVEGGRQYFRSILGLVDDEGRPVRETPIEQSLCRTVVGTDAPLVLRNASADPRFCDHPAVRDLKIGSYLGHPVRAPDGTPLGSLCVLGTEPRDWSDSDVETVRDLAELASREVALRLEANEATQRAVAWAGISRFLQDVLDAVPAALAILDDAGSTLAANSAWVALPGLGEAGAPQVLAHPEVREGLRALRQGEMSRFAWDRHQREGGQDRWFQLEALRIELETGPATLVRVEDLTHLRDTEKELRLLREAVDHSRDLLLITDSVEGPEEDGEPGNVLEQDRGPTILFANQAFYDATGYEPREVIGRRLRFPAPEAGAEALRIREAYREGRPVRAEIRNRRKSGERFWVEVDMVPVTDLEGKRTHWVSAQRDITTRRQQERRLAEQEGALRVQDRLEVAGRLAGGIAHDFNNLLTVILSNLELLALDAPSRTAPPPEVADALEAAEKARRLVGQLLALARRQILVAEEVGVNALVAEVASIVGAMAPAGCRVRAEPDPGEPLLWADRGQVQQLLLNLGMNALDAMTEPGEVLYRVEIVARGSGDRASDGLPLMPGPYVEVSVDDEGPGVPDTIRDRIFEPFFTTKSAPESRGLGLSTSLGIARQMGGELDVGRSEVLGGASFRVRIPLHDRSEKGDASGGPTSIPNDSRS